MSSISDNTYSMQAFKKINILNGWNDLPKTLTDDSTHMILDNINEPSTLKLSCNNQELPPELGSIHWYLYLFLAKLKGTFKDMLWTSEYVYGSTLALH